MKSRLTSLAFLFIFNLAPHLYAQVSSKNSTFSIAYDKGCAPFTVNITSNLSLDPGISRQYTFENEPAPSLDTFHTFINPGIYNIAQILGQDANKFDTLQVEVFDPVLPGFTVNQCSGNGIVIDITDTNYDFYRVYFTANDSLTLNPGESSSPFLYPSAGNQQVRVKGFFNGAEENCGESTQNVGTVDQLTPGEITGLSMVNVGETDGSMQISFNLAPDIKYDLELSTDTGNDFRFLQKVTNNSSLTVNGLDTQNSFFCFRVIVVDACSGETQTSNLACSATLFAEAKNGFHEVQWNILGDLQLSYDVIKDGALLTSITDPEQRNLIDSLVTCGVENCYTLNIDQGNFTYVTPQACATGIAITNPPPVHDITATVDGNDVNLSWKIAENGMADTVIIRRARGNQTLKEITRTTAGSHTDQSPGVNQASFRYDIFYEDECGNQSDVSNFSNTIFLKADNTTGNTYNLNWNKYNGWFAGVRNYFVQKMDNSGNLLEEEKAISVFTQKVVLTNLDREPVTFRIRAESLDFVPQEAFSNRVTLEFVPTLFVPKAFTPNGDGLNDELFIQGTSVSSFEFFVYNRWGEVVFHSNNINRSWDGTIKQKNAASGTYTYSLKFTDEQGKKFTRRGSFVLIR